MRRQRVVKRLRLRWRRALFDLLVCLVSVAGMAVFDGPVGGPIGFGFFVAWNIAGFDLAMIATEDHWM